MATRGNKRQADASPEGEPSSNRLCVSTSQPNPAEAPAATFNDYKVHSVVNGYKCTYTVSRTETDDPHVRDWNSLQSYEDMSFAGYQLRTGDVVRTSEGWQGLVLEIRQDKERGNVGYVAFAWLYNKSKDLSQSQQRKAEKNKVDEDWIVSTHIQIWPGDEFEENVGSILDRPDVNTCHLYVAKKRGSFFFSSHRGAIEAAWKKAWDFRHAAAALTGDGQLPDVAAPSSPESVEGRRQAASPGDAQLPGVAAPPSPRYVEGRGRANSTTPTVKDKLPVSVRAHSLPR